jgi:hypothetical protein
LSGFILKLSFNSMRINRVDSDKPVKSGKMATFNFIED